MLDVLDGLYFTLKSQRERTGMLKTSQMDLQLKLHKNVKEKNSLESELKEEKAKTAQLILQDQWFRDELKRMDQLLHPAIAHASTQAKRSMNGLF